MDNNSKGYSLNVKMSNDEFTACLKKYKYWFALSIIVFLFAAFAYQWLHQPIFNVSTVIELNHIKTNSGKQTQFLSQTSDNRLQSFTKIIRSDDLLKKMQQPIDTGLLEDELNDLQFIAGSNPNTLVLSINTTLPQQTRLFLNNLYAVYEHENKKTASIQDLNDSLAFLSLFITDQTKKESLLKIKIEQSDGTKRTPAQNFEVKKQLDILKTIKPYLLNSSRQFQLIPTTFPITDHYINNLILQFNDAQNDKQSLLSDDADQKSIAAANQKITEIQNLLTAAIDSASAQNFETINGGSIVSLNNKAIKDTLINRQIIIDEGISKYAALLARKQAYQRPDFIAGNSSCLPLTINVNPVNGNIFGLYIIAILSGILLPFAIIYTFSSHFKSAFANTEERITDIPVLGHTGSPTNSIKLASKINHLLASKLNKVILLTSDTILKKDLIALEIGFNLISKKDKLVIVDLDFDIDSTNNISAQPIQPGVIDFVTGRTTTLTDIVMPGPDKAISTIGKGRNPKRYPSIKGNDFVPDSAHADMRDMVLNSEKLGLLISHLSTEFNHILFTASSVNYPPNILPLTKLSDINLVIFNTRSIPGAAKFNLNKLVVKNCIKDIYIIKNR